MASTFLAVALGLIAAMHSSVALAGPAVIQIPEPSSLGLMAAGVGVAAWLKFRGRK